MPKSQPSSETQQKIPPVTQKKKSLRWQVSLFQRYESHELATKFPRISRTFY